MIRAAQCDQNVILRVPMRNQQKKNDREGLHPNSFLLNFIERFIKKLLKSCLSRFFFLPTSRRHP
ncbi:hypothetical protein RHMOL_Rhmol09G0054000 [Rhododendron molle]|uniref:Uncharacterized protein n=1 Tax=Rhododendron molle TaxID=49168 RepID=A0ACC0MB90_RHOML|nr:hypothetical protein RHMOL_Rhmol09G0054000 [Rhododendron molle]